MSEQTSFSNREILNSALLSSMAYKEDQYMYDLHVLQDEHIPKDKIDAILNNVIKNDINYLNLLNSIESLLKELINLPTYDNIINKKIEFYTTFQDELGLKNLDQSYIQKIAKRDCLIETKEKILNKIINHSDLKDSFSEEIISKFEKEITQLTIREKSNFGKDTLNHDLRELWQKFSPIVYSEELQNKYNHYNPKNNRDIQASFKNGYIEVGKTGKYKDGNCLIGHIEENGEQVLYISFRGTEKRIKSASKYFLENYPNMERQYNYFEPILKDIIEAEIKKHKLIYPDKKLNVVFTGHSLGAALAEKSLDKFKDTQDVSYKGIFVSNPGSFHYLQGLVNLLDEIDNKLDDLKISRAGTKCNKFLSIGTDCIKIMLKASIKTIKTSLLIAVGGGNSVLDSAKIGFEPLDNKIDNKTLVKIANKITAIPTFLQLNFAIKTCLYSPQILVSLITDHLIDKKHADSRACTINHERDNIPQAGKALFQNSNSQQIILTDKLEHVEQKGTIKSIVHFEYHGREIYYTELKSKSEAGVLFEHRSKQINVLDKIKMIRDNFNKNESKEKNKQHF